MDDDGNLLPQGETGELVIRGPQVMKGYWQRPEETAKVITEDGWLRTGDVAMMTPDGFFKIVDRKKDMFISGGENVSPAEVEAVLREHPEVAEVGVAGLPDSDLGSRVVAWIVPRVGADPGAGDLRRFCRQRLAGFKVAKEVRFTAELPRNSSGKLLRRSLRELD